MRTTEQNGARNASSLDKLLLQGSFNEILVFDGSTRKAIEANRSSRTNLQYTLPELRRLGIRDIFIDEKIPALKPGVGHPRAFEGRLRRKDGSTYPAEIRLFANEEGGRLLHVAIINDLSTREASRHALVRHKSDYKALVSNIPGMAFQVFESGDGEVSLPFVSANSRLLLGIKPQSLQANPAILLDLILPEDLVSYRKTLDENRGRHLTFNWEGRIWVEAWKDIKWINVRVSKRDTGDGTLWDGIMLNITQGKLAREDLEKSREELRRLALHVERVKEQERKRIAREVHDELGGNLTAIKIGVSWLARNAGKDKPKADERLKYIDEVVDHTLDAIHRISSDLRPSILDFGIVSALRWQTDQLCRTAGIECRFFTKLKQVDLDDETAVAIFRIAQEAMTNIARHARATQVEVVLGKRDHQIQLDIVDNGIGPKLVSTKSRKRSFGLIGMAERASALGAQFSMEPGPQGGTRIRLTLPLSAGESSPELEAGSNPEVHRRKHSRPLHK